MQAERNPRKTCRPQHGSRDRSSRNQGSAWGSQLRLALDGCRVDELATMAKRAPDAYKHLLAYEASARRLEWAGFMTQIAGHVCGLVALVVLAAVAWHAIDQGAATQGASIICTGAVSIVALFVTGRLTINSHRHNGSGKRGRQGE